MNGIDANNIGKPSSKVDKVIIVHQIDQHIEVIQKRTKDKWRA